MLILVRDLWVPAIVLPPFILIRTSEYSKVTLNHEYIHLKQMKETLIIGAYIVYILELLVKWVAYRSFSKARKNVSFEREAKKYEKVIGYAGWRKPYSWVKYMYL